MKLDADSEAKIEAIARKAALMEMKGGAKKKPRKPGSAGQLVCPECGHEGTRADFVPMGDDDDEG